MINFDDAVKVKIKEHHPNQSQIPGTNENFNKLHVIIHLLTLKAL